MRFQEVREFGAATGRRQKTRQRTCQLGKQQCQITVSHLGIISLDSSDNFSLVVKQTKQRQDQRQSLFLRNLSRAGHKKSEPEFVPNARGSQKIGKSDEIAGRGAIPGKSGGKGKSSFTEGRSRLSYCNGCIFSLKYDGPQFLQITNGFITADDQITEEVDDIAICDNCKCAGSNTEVVMMSVEGECDPWAYVDVLEFTAGTTLETGDTDVICPDVTWFASAACDVWSMDPDGMPRVGPLDQTDTTLFPPGSEPLQIILEGPVANIQMQDGFYYDCTVVCSNPNPPLYRPTEPTSKKSMKSNKTGNMSKSSRTPAPSSSSSPPTEFGYQFLRSSKSSGAKEVFETYDPFIGKFPILTV